MHGGEPLKQLAMEGNRAFSLGLNNVNFRVERISNNRIGGASGTLMVKLWALQSPFEGEAERLYRGS